MQKITIHESSRKLSKENFKSKCEIGVDNGVITTRFNNYKFIKILIENTCKVITGRSTRKELRAKQDTNTNKDQGKHKMSSVFG
jgi:hypothetical protein